MPAGVSSGEATKYIQLYGNLAVEGVIYKNLFCKLCASSACLGLTPYSGWESGGW